MLFWSCHKLPCQGKKINYHAKEKKITMPRKKNKLPCQGKKINYHAKEKKINYHAKN
jgi:hypothetical protein